MTAGQEKFYWSLWARLKRAQPGVDRHATHRELGLPESHTAWNNRHFDQWRAHCLAASQPGNLDAQLDAARQPVTRRLFAIRQLAAALGLGPDELEAVVRDLREDEQHMAGSDGRMGSAGARLEDLSTDGLDAVRKHLRAQARRKFPSKDAVLSELAAEAAFHRLDMVAVKAEVARALPGRPESLAAFSFDDLLAVLAIFRRFIEAPAAV